QPKRVASHEFELGLTEEVEGAIPKTVRIVLEEIGVKNGATINHQGTHLWASPGETTGDSGDKPGEKV
ncbi:MAG: coenzyme F420 hydrogenase, partial [Methanoculleus sp.]|nr:coenzyme F420 hydrogenase [Methanoculleus sp.]